MPRTTLDIEAPILEDLRALQKMQGRSMGSIASELLAEGLAGRRRKHRPARAALAWISRAMGAPHVDIDDKEALHALLDRDVSADHAVRARPPRSRT